MMPDIDGFALINMFKQALKKDIPTISTYTLFYLTPCITVMSSSSSPSIITQVFKHGAEDFLQKPIKEEMLAARIKKTFEIRDQQQRQKKLEEQVRIEQKYVESMSEQIEKNKKEIFEYKKNVSDTIETPLEFIIGTIKDMVNNKIEKDQYKVALMTVLKSLGASDLYKPAFVNLLQSSNLDDSTRSWLISQYTKDNATNYKMPIPIASKPQQNDKLPFDLDACVPPAEVSKIGFNALILNHPELKQMVMYMFKSLDLFNQFKLPPVNLWNLLNMLEKEYKANYYHNFKHCVDVTQYVYMLISDPALALLLTPFHKFTLLVSALCHDVDHPGLNNNFLINSHHELANIYNDKSVLENHHASRSSYLMNEGATNVLCGLTQEQYREFRRQFTQLILATDMANHFSIVSKFELKVTTSTWTSENAEDMNLLLRVIIKCADISNVTRPFDVAKRWAALCLEEFSSQGDKEKENNLPISPLMDRDKLNIPKSQIDFTDFIVSPLFKNLVASFTSLHFIATNIQENRKTWKLMTDFLEKDKMTGPYKLSVALQKLADFETYLQTQNGMFEANFNV